MAVVKVSDDANRILTMDGSPVISFGTIGGGAGAGAEVVTFFQGTQSSSRKITASTDNGFWMSNAVPEDFVGSPDGSANKVVMFKIFLSDFSDLVTLGDGVGGTTTEIVDGGLCVRFASATNAYGVYFIHDDGTLPAHQGGALGGAYPPTRSWLVAPINPRPKIEQLNKDGILPIGATSGPDTPHTPWVASSGTPDMAAIDVWAVHAAVNSGAAKSENLFIDSIDQSDGLFLTGGTGTDPAGTFSDFVDYDEGDINVRIGHVITQEGIIFAAGKLVIGRNAVAGSPSGIADATVFDDTGSVVIFPGAQVHPGWHAIEVDLDDPGTTVSLADCVFRGISGKPDTVWYQNSNDTDTVNHWGYGDIRSGNIRHDLHKPGHFNIGDWLQQYDYFGGFVNWGQGIGALQAGRNLVFAYDEGAGFESPEFPGVYRFYDTDAFGGCRDGSSAGQLSKLSDGVQSNGSFGQYMFVQRVDLRPDFIVTETASPVGTLNVSGCVYDNFRTITGSLESTFTSCKFISPAKINQNSATFDGCEFSDAQNLRGTGMLIADNLAAIKDCTFTSTIYEDVYFNTSQSPTVISPHFSRNTVEGHAIEITVAGTYTFDGNVFNGYDANNEITFNVNTGIAGGASPKRFQGSITSDAPHGLTSGDPVMYTRAGGVSRIEGAGSPIMMGEGAIYYVDVIDANTFTISASPGIALASGHPDNLFRMQIPLQPSTDSPEEVHAFYPPGTAILNSSGGLVTINVVNGAAPSVANINGSSTVVNTNVAVTITNIQPGSEVRVYPSSSQSPLDLTEIDGIESTGSPSEFTFTAPAGTAVDIVIFNINFVLPPDNRIRDFVVPNTATSFPVTQVPDRNFSNP
jgi:hypothetical protein